MTRFLDGPAAGKVLMLKSTPFFLRVVIGGGVDALDQPGDTPEDDETLIAYELSDTRIGMCHINRRGRGGSGFYPMAGYIRCKLQPTQEVMRDRKTWVRWCEIQAAIRGIDIKKK